MDLEKLQSIVGMLKGTDITEFELEEEGCNLRISRQSTVVGGVAAPVLTVSQLSQESASATHYQATETVVDEELGLSKIESPIVGTFYSRPAPDAEAYVKVGDKVKKGDKLCIIEAMKLMNEIEATVSGTVEKIMLTDGQVVEYGEVLFLIRE